MFRYFSKAALSRSGRGLSGLLVLGLVQGCSLSNSIDDVAPKSYSSSFIKADDSQSKIGEKEHPVVLAKYGGEYRNKAAETLVAIIVGRLVAVSEDKQQVYKITILNTPKVNAFALPGGYLYVTRGLLALAKSRSYLPFAWTIQPELSGRNVRLRVQL